MFVVSQLITAKKKNESAWFTNHSSLFQCLLWKVNLSLETWDVIIMKNLYANDSEFYIVFFIQPKLLVLHVKPMFILFKRTLSSELGRDKIRNNQKN